MQLVLLLTGDLHLIKGCWIGEAFQVNLGSAEQHGQCNGPFQSGSVALSERLMGREACL